MSGAGGQAITPERILQLMWSYAPPLILAAAVQHRIFDLLQNWPQTAEEIATGAGTSVRGARCLLNALVGLEFLTKVSGNRYGLKPESAAFLVSTQPGYLGGMLQHQRDLISQWLDLADVVKTGRSRRPVHQDSGGAQFFEQLVGALFPMNYPAAQVLGRTLSEGRGPQPLKILDVGAGSGVWGIGVAQQSPRATVTAVDWPNVLEVTRRFAGQSGLAGRFSYIPGDMGAVDYGAGYDVVIFGHVLHGEGEQHSRKLLQKAFDALVPGGAIAIAEFLVNPDHTGPVMGVIFAINMLVHTDEGDTYAFEQISQWLEAAGFVGPRRVEPGGPASLIVARKPQPHT